MGNYSRRVIAATFLCLMAALLVFLVYSIATFQPKLVLSAFLWRWAWNQSLVYLIEALIPLQCTALMVYYSLLDPNRGRGRTLEVYEPFYRLVNSVLVTLLVFTLLFTALAEGVRPWLFSRQEDMLNQTRLAKLFYSNYEAAQHDGRYENAEYYLNLYLQINPRNQLAQRQLDQAKLNAAKAHSGPPAGPPQPPETARYRNESANGLVKIAQSYLRKTDYSSAHYYATLALRIAPGDAEAGRISRETLNDLSKITTSPSEREQKYYFNLKSTGRADLDSGNVIDAYYLFHTLSESHPKDPDVVSYLKRATDRLTQFAFFRDEVQKAAPYPGTQNILFVNHREASGAEFVLFRKMVTLVSGTYVMGIEAARYSASGRMVYHLTAPYGKLIGNRLSMFCISRDTDVRYLPTVLTGSFPDTHHYQLPISASVGTLEQIGSFNSNPSRYGIPRLWTLAATLPEYGYPSAPFRIEFLRRAMIPFGFLIFSIFAIGIGWSLRVPRKRPSFFAFLFVPLVPYVIYLFETFYLFSGKILFTFVMTVGGFWPALLSLVGVQFVLVILALVYLAGRSTEQ